MSSIKENAVWSKLADFFLHGKCQSEVALAAANKAYPGSSEQFDVFLELGNGDRVFMEGKAAWKSWWMGRNNLGKFRTYLFYPLVPCISPDKKSAGLDLRKLYRCAPPDTKYVIQVIYGSALPAHNVGNDLDAFARLARINAPPWHTFARKWTNHQWPDYDLDVRTFVCPYEGLSDWWKTVESMPWPHEGNPQQRVFEV